MKTEQIIGAIVLALVVGGLAIIYSSPEKDGGAKSNGISEVVSPYVELVDPSGFVNTNGQSIALKDYVGKKVILLDVMTYSCINCQRTFPYVTAWYEKYKDDGFVVIGLHTPEFAFEKDIKNVEAAMNKFGITYPVVLDNEYKTWNAYGNRYWPRKYLIDIHGNIVYDHIGEGAYEETEMQIRDALAERALVLGTEMSATESALAANSIPTRTTKAQSPETYFGSARNEYLANGTPGIGGMRTYVVPTTTMVNNLYLGGTWELTPEYARSVLDSTVVYKYKASEVYLVMSSDFPSPVEVWQDGRLVKTISVHESTLYVLIENEEPGEHTLELKIKNSGTQLYAFTFG